MEVTLLKSHVWKLPIVDIAVFGLAIVSFVSRGVLLKEW